MANQAPITPAAPAATFDAAQWLSHFESIGGGFLATESQTSLCIACQGTTPENQSAAHAMLRDLTDEQRAGVIVHIRERVGLSAPQPDLKVVCSQEVSEPAGISPPSSGQTLGQSEGSHDMDMTHSFTPALSDAAAAKFEAANHAYVDADKAMNDFDQQYLQPASDQWRAWRDHWPIKTPDSNAEYVASRDAASALLQPVQDRFDRLAYDRGAALMTLISAPAPDIAAVTRKVQVLIDTQEWDGGDCESHLKHILADLQQVSGSHPPAMPDATSNWSSEEMQQRTLSDFERLLVPPAFPRDEGFWALVNELEAVEATPFDPEADDDDINRASELLGAIMTLPVRDPTATKWKLDYMMPEAAWVPEYIEQIKADYTLWLGAPAAAHNVDASLHAAWGRFLANREALEALPMEGAESRAAENAYCDAAGNAEDEILKATATTPAGAAVKLRAALSNLLAGSFEQEAALRRNDLASLSTASLDLDARLVLSALHDLEAMSALQIGDGRGDQSMKDVAPPRDDLTGMLAGYLAQHNAVLTLAEAKQVFDITFSQRQATSAAHTEWEYSEAYSFDFDHPIERALRDALLTHEASWKLLAGSSVETMAELQEKVDLCRADPDIECEGFRDLLINRIQSDMRHLSERKAA
ncbi:hypothetical protein [Novosphingobium rosa]|uniref:hypothetical protein n=1 Tax=Novosphingobium rosa TaxID=76978 RepID=UPI00082C29F9|nr:hypothetical protein [Novosphingobium rosa]